MLKEILLSICLLTILSASASAKEDSLYLKGFLGGALPASGFSGEGARYQYDEITENGGFVIGGAIGKDFADFSAEIEASYESYKIDQVNWSSPALELDWRSNSVDGDFSKYALKAKGYYHLPEIKNFNPYLGLGAGIAYHQMSDIEISYGQSNKKINSSNAFAPEFYAIAGVNYDFKKFKLGLEYEYSKTLTEIEFDELQLDRDGHAVRAAITFPLP